MGQANGSFTAALVPPHGVRLFKVTPQKKAAIRVNDDDLRVGYDGTWTRNNNAEVPAVSEPLTVAVTDSGTAPTAPQASTSGTRTVELNNDDPGIVYTGSWSRSTGRGLGDYQDDVQYTEGNGDAFSYSFVGNGVDYITEKDPSQGEVEIYVDGALKATVDTHADTRSAQQLVYSISDLPNGSHTIRGVKKSGQFMLVDKLVVRQESLLNPGTGAFDKGAPADVTTEIGRDPGELVSISNAGKTLVKGTDYTIAGKVVTISKAYLATQPVGSTKLDFSFHGDYRDDVHAAAANGAAINFTFKGTSVNWVTALAPDQGDADVFIDGSLVTRVNLHSDVRVTTKQVFSKTGLSAGQHTLRVVKVSGDLLRNDVLGYTVG
jgi:hypothetical protein